MRYERLTEIFRLATRLQGSRGGMTMDDIAEEFRVSRRTAERMRDAVEAVFGPVESVVSGEKRIHWRLRSSTLRGLVGITPEEIAELESAAGNLDRTGLAERARMLRELVAKLRALRRPLSEDAFEEDLEALMRAEGLAMRPGPRTRVEPGLLPMLRDAIKVSRKVEFDYEARASARCSRQLVEPYGVLYGNRAFLVGRADWGDESLLWRLANVSNARSTGETFVRDPDFDLQEFAERSFGTYQEEPVDVVLRFDADAARDAATFLFHPTQTFSENDDGSLTVKFRAGGLNEMCWHLFTWGESVAVEQPVELRERLRKLCEEIAEHHAVPPRSDIENGLQACVWRRREVTLVTVVPEPEMALIAGEKARFGQGWHGHCSVSVAVKVSE